MVQVKKHILYNKTLFILLVELCENPLNSYQLAKKLKKNPSVIYRHYEHLKLEKHIIESKEGINYFQLNYEKLASEFLKYLSNFIYNKQVYNLNNRLEKNILLHSLIKQYLKLSYSYNEINTLEGVFELMIEQMAFVNKNVLEGLDKSTKQLFKEIIEVKSKHKEMINNMIKNYKKGDDIK